MIVHTLGFPRMGLNREWKWALERYWRGESTPHELEATGREVRQEAVRMQREAGVDLFPVGDFSLYDHMLDMTMALGAVPERFQATSAADPDRLFALARGTAEAKAMEMTKWFDTNYHYIVPELRPDTRFRADAGRLHGLIGEQPAPEREAKLVLPGPFTFLALSRFKDADCDRWELLDRLVDAYVDLLRAVAPSCAWVQLDEPLLATDCDAVPLQRLPEIYARLRSACAPARLLLATYFGPVDHHCALLCPEEGKPFADALHLDLVRGPEQLAVFLEHLPKEMSLSLGLVDGRNVWRADLDQAFEVARNALDVLGPERLLLAPSCSLLHCPLDLEQETGLEPRIRSWMAFARQKCAELDLLRDLLEGKAGREAELEACRAAWADRRSGELTRDPAVTARVDSVKPEMARRASPYAERALLQRERLRLPLLPTTTIGSFPQTAELRRLRQEYKRGDLPCAEYEEHMREAIRGCVRTQERLGLDVLVHGEPERNDMVEYFGQRLRGFCFTCNGWVQSYGSRCVKPPIIYGDVSRPAPMTVAWTGYAQSLTEKPVKGMLTGPVTILCWSFVRDDQPRGVTCRQIALALRDEVLDLEESGHAIIQVDEPALREGLPLRRAEQRAYLDWASECFRLAVSGVHDKTQIHTHMCYADFNEIIQDIAGLDADVISMEASRSDMVLLDAFAHFHYPNEIGPGVWDIHSPRVPSTEEMVRLLRAALRSTPRERLWVNPDCGLKTRAWPETLASLENMVEAARRMREAPSH
ncbi:MAG: 5-methyltetrahydropteroyltriglutamate--homocysteine S-methyltransferase [Desulfovibrio sp.]